jgi:hypothetical protein
MSDHGHAASSEGHGDHHNEYLGVPANEASPGEPTTPGWLTLLGIGLALATLLAFIAMQPAGKTRAELAPAAASVAAAATAPAPAATPPARPLGMPNGFPAARPAGSAPLRLPKPGAAQGLPAGHP